MSIIPNVKSGEAAWLLKMKQIIIDGESLTIEQVLQVAYSEITEVSVAL